MSCIGKYRRNLIDLVDNSFYITCWALYACLDGLLLLLAMTTNSPVFAPENFFFLYNLVTFLSRGSDSPKNGFILEQGAHSADLLYAQPVKSGAAEVDGGVEENTNKSTTLSLPGSEEFGEA